MIDVSDPHKPKQILEQRSGDMASQSWDAKRINYTTSLLSAWDKTGDDEQFLKAYAWDGQRLTPRFAIDFTQEKLGRPHLMTFGAANLY